MKGISSLILSLLLLTGFGQQYSNLIVQSDDSVSFLLEVDDILMTDTARCDIKVEEIHGQSHQVKLTLIQHNDQVVQKALYFENMGVEATMKLVNLNGEYKLRYFGEVSMGAAPISENQTLTNYNIESPAQILSPTIDVSQMSKVEAYSYEVTNGTSHTDLVTNETPENNIESEIEVSEAMDTAVVDYVQDSLILDSLSNLLNANQVNSPGVLDVVVNYKGDKGCALPDLDVDQLVNRVNSSDFSSQKLKLARTGVKNKCITTDQVELIANSLEFEDEKLAFVKFAYQFTYDQDSYQLLMRLFRIQSTKSDFSNFLKQ